MILKVVYVFVFGLLLSSFCSFLLNQATLFLSLQQEFEEQRKHDIYTLHEICLDDEIKNAIGEVNSGICREIESRILLSPTTKAFQEVLNKIHLCGTYPCSSYIKELLQLIFFDWKVVLVIGVVLPFLTKFISKFFFRSSNRRNNSIYRIDGGIPFNARSPDNQYYISTNDETF